MDNDLGVLTFDCYETLLDLSCVGQIAQEYGVDSKKAWTFFSSYEDRLMYGESFRSFEQLIREILRFVDFEMRTDGFKKTQIVF